MVKRRQGPRDMESRGAESRMEQREVLRGGRREDVEPEVFRHFKAAESGVQAEAGVRADAGTGAKGTGAGANAGMGPERRTDVTGEPRVVERLRYLSPNGEDAAEAEAAGENDASQHEVWEERLAARDADWQARLKKVREEALAEGRAELEGRRMELLRECSGRWTEAVGSFAHARDNYFARVEREVVDLALAIASRILQREAQVDPLLLAGAVRVALGQLAETTTVELRVPEADRELWTETLRLMPNLPVMPTVVADREMTKGECVLTTELGRVDLGVRAQLKEIERGFFDLLSHRDSAAVRGKAGVGV